MKPLEASTGERSARGRGKRNKPDQEVSTLRIEEEGTCILP
jgi:hypothetical protein